MPGTAKVLGSNLTGTCFFSNRKHTVSNEFVGLLFVSYLLSVYGSVLESFAEHAVFKVTFSV